MKAINVDGIIKVYKQLPKIWKNHLNFIRASEELQKEEGFYNVVKPSYNTSTQYLGEIYFDEVDEVFTYPVIDKTQEQLDQEKEAYLSSLDHQFDQEAAKRLLREVVAPRLADEASLTEQDIEDAKMLYKQWRIGVTYDKDSDNIDEKRFVYNGDLYKVIGAKHTSQADWTPDTAVSLYTKIVPPGAIPEWNADDYTSYELGTKVIHNSIIYQCINPTYAWIEPGTQDSHFGWVEV
jgi:hypothetical protein